MDRIYHTWDKWECYPAGFYEEHPPKGITKEKAVELYIELLSDIPLFEDVLELVIFEWKHSCEHYLTNERMNRIAWLGQASLAYQYHIPAKFRIGYHELSDEKKIAADQSALKCLNIWLKRQGHKELTMEEAQSKTEPNLY